MTGPLRSKEWREFVAWCQGRKLRALPAHGWTVASYALWCEANKRHRTLEKRLDAIIRVHLARGYRPPDRSDIVLKTLATLAERREQAARQTRGSRALFDGQDLLKPKSAGLKDSTTAPPPLKSRSLRTEPPLVSRRPET